MPRTFRKKGENAVVNLPSHCNPPCLAPVRFFFGVTLSRESVQKVYIVAIDKTVTPHTYGVKRVLPSSYL